jgi:hypothetical protein
MSVTDTVKYTGKRNGWRASQMRIRLLIIQDQRCERSQARGGGEVTGITI